MNFVLFLFKQQSNFVCDEIRLLRLLTKKVLKKVFFLVFLMFLKNVDTGLIFPFEWQWLSWFDYDFVGWIILFVLSSLTDFALLFSGWDPNGLRRLCFCRRTGKSRRVRKKREIREDWKEKDQTWRTQRTESKRKASSNDSSFSCLSKVSFFHWLVE